jgi:general secretion pathway protein C
MSPRISRAAVLTAGVLTALSLASAGARATWRLFGETGADLPDAPLRAPAAATALPDIGPILALAPFGETARAAPALGAPAETSLNLTLQGVALARPASRSSAFIGAPGEPGRYYRVGEEVPGGAVLQSVARDHVELLVGGRREILSFPNGAQARGVAAMRALLPEGVRGDQQASPPAAVPPPSAQRISADEVIDDYRQRIAANPQAVLDQLGLVNVAEGYRVGEGSPEAVRRAGLRAGDIVTRVNGVPVGEVEADRRLFEEIVAAGSARVEIMRGDRVVTLSFPLK